MGGREQEQVGWTSQEGQVNTRQALLWGAPSSCCHVCPPASTPGFLPFLAFNSPPTPPPRLAHSEQGLSGIWVWCALQVLVGEEKMDSFRDIEHLGWEEP